MTNSPDPRGFSSGRRGRKTVFGVVAVAVLLLFVALSPVSRNWSLLNDFTWRGGVRVTQATLRLPDTLGLGVASCNGDPEVVSLRETDLDVQVRVVSSSWPFSGADDCADGVTVQLQEPFGDRILIDKHTGKPVSVRPGASVTHAVLRSPDRLLLYVDSCDRNPQFVLREQTDHDVQIMVVISSTPHGPATECQDVVEFHLREPLGDRVVIDRWTGKVVNVESEVSVRGEVSVVGAEWFYDDRFTLYVDSCDGNPELALLLATDVGVQVEVVATSAPFESLDDCQDSIDIRLQKPLGRRDVVDLHTGQAVTLTHLVELMAAELLFSDRIRFMIGSCLENAEVSLVRETDVDVQVKVVDSVFPFGGGGLDCAGGVTVNLQKPLGDRVVVDLSTGWQVDVDLGPNSGELAPEGEPSSVEVAQSEIDDPIGDAERQDLRAATLRYGISLQQASDRHGWHENFVSVAIEIGEAFPAAFAGAAITDAGHAWFAFAGRAPEGALDMIDAYSSGYGFLSVEVRTGLGFTEAELRRAVAAVRHAVYESPNVPVATTAFDYATGQITLFVRWDGTVSSPVLDDLLAATTKAITDATRADILESITYSMVRR